MVPQMGVGVAFRNREWFDWRTGKLWLDFFPTCHADENQHPEPQAMLYGALDAGSGPA
jgi:hypothetical protein